MMNGNRKPGTGFVMSTSPCETPIEQKIIFKNNNDLAFTGVPNEQKPAGYEVDEDDLLKKLREKEFPVKIKKCNNYYVGDGIGDGYKHWESQKPVFISAQTGRGKNTFIEGVLIPYMKDLNYRDNTKKEILILSNRIALNTQLKNRIENTGVAKVLLYQSFLNFLDSNQYLERYKYVACDECHFFTSDANFNPNTALILEKIIMNFQESIRIYMSSTFNDCLEYIFKFEKRIHGLCHSQLPEKKNKVLPPDNLFFLYYQFERDYSYLDIKYYSEYTELEDIIIKSIENGEKWLIFIDNRKKCRYVKDTLLKYYKKNKRHVVDALTDSDITIIDAESKNDDEYIEAISVEKFDCKILISTSVIDNGVNLKDPSLKNIVISDINKNKCLQMVGRKRVEDGETVNLYIMKFSEKYIEKLKLALEIQKEAYGLFNRAYSNSYDTKNSKWEILKAKREFNERFYNGSISDFEDAKHWFYRDKETPELVHPNEIAVLFVDEILIPKYEYILNRMEKTGSGQEFLEHQLSWFGQCYVEENDITLQNTMSAKEQFDEYVDSLLGRIIPKNEQDLFGTEFFEKHLQAYGLRNKAGGYRSNDNPARTKSYGKSVINDVFKVRGKNLIIETDKNSDWEIKEKT